ncbi:hypothetical protein [Arthrobacter sp. K5]|uniref:DUF1049 domain-containing protein n=1 Tax=Arthrobacter sp. K5 TaxID=2839623 RepID=A0AAU8EK99_9MICC
MDLSWLPLIASILGTTSVSAVVTALLVPRTEARKLHKEIEDLKSTLQGAAPESTVELQQALEATGFRLASLSLVRYKTIVGLIAGGIGVLILAIAGGAMATVAGAATGVQDHISASFRMDPFGSWAIAAGVLLWAIAVGIGFGFFRAMLLKSARTKYVKVHLDRIRSGQAPAPVREADFKGANWLFDIG